MLTYHINKRGLTVAKRIMAVTAITGLAQGFTLTAASEGAFEFETGYTNEVWSVVSGADDNQAKYLDHLTAGVGIDTEKLFGLEGSSVFVSAIYNNGESISDIAGDAQIISNIEAGVSAVRLYEAWFEQQIGANTSLKAGLYDLNSEFDVLESANLFINSGHGIGSDIGLTGQSGPSIFPITGLGIRLQSEFSPGLTGRIVVLDGVPGDPNDPSRTEISFDDGDGALAVAEIEAAITDGKFLVGYWTYTEDFEALDGTQKDGNQGLYLRAERKLTSVGDDPNKGLSGFGRLGVAEGDINPFSVFAGAGLNYSGPFERRPDDQVGIAIAAAFTSDAARDIAPSEDAEINVELTYRFQVNENIAVQPNIQYVANPSASSLADDVLAVGIRAEFGISFQWSHAEWVSKIKPPTTPSFCPKWQMAEKSS